jgi:mannonate dehydratase
MPVAIQKIRCILTAPERIRLVVVKVETSEPGLYGLGCATFTQRPLAVVEAVHQYLDPFLRGRNVDEIEDIHHAAYVSSYWRNGPVLNNAISGVDMALWDIKGKRAKMPVHELLGGKCRRCAPVYMHASGREIPEVVDRARTLWQHGFRHIRIQVGVPGQQAYGAGGRREVAREVDGPTTPQSLFEPADYVRIVPKLFEKIREELGDEVELLHDVHERVPPPLAIQLARDLEKYRPFFYEDPFAPEDMGHFRRLRQLSSIPIAMGELFNNPNEYVPLIKEQLIDFIRVHLSQVGGISPARKLAALCEFFGVRTAWHGPGDTSPVGHAANLGLDLCCYNFGIQEIVAFGANSREVFPGCPEVKEGAVWPNDKPGLGIDIDEKAAAKFPYPDHPFNGAWPAVRRRDGSVIRP